ncbi:MAG: MFS transporter [Desulfobulbaceae bacterium]|nr:MFS transporter [Desulfobulbaceae bacterium]HIJ91091.1 MFS transporter [Deltaproteobacteria bacterium]
MSSPANKWPTFLIVATGVFMSTLDSSMVNIALPFIMKDFHSSLGDTQWVVMIYLLTITATLLFWGHLSDRLGRGKIYASGLLIFGLGSLACAYAPVLAFLVAARFCQALGAAMMMAVGPAIIKETFPKEQLGRGLGLIGMAVSLGLMSGPSLGGFLLEFASWRFLFFITVPLGLIFAFLAGRILPGPTRHYSGPLDWLGSLTWATALVLLSLTLTHASSASWSATRLLLTGSAGAGALCCFIAIEARLPHPLLTMSLFRNRHFSLAMISAVLSFMVLFAVILLTPFHLDRVLGLSPSRIGLVMLAIPSSILVVSPLAGWLSDYVGARFISTLGLSVSTLGVFSLSTIQVSTPPFVIAGQLMLLGLGQSLFLSPNSASVLSHVEAGKAGAAAALLATARNLGMLLGIAQAALLFSMFFRGVTNGLDLRDFRPEHTASFLTALHGALLGAALTGLLGAAASWLRGKPTHHRPEE